MSSTGHLIDDAPLTKFHKKLTLSSSGGPFIGGFALSIGTRRRADDRRGQVATAGVVHQRGTQTSFSGHDHYSRQKGAHGGRYRKH
ncbi:hypothetical protein ACWEO2_30925 [Nocardia sp. NPDC004278]